MTFKEQNRIDTLKTANLWVFVQHEPMPIDNVKKSKAYTLWEKSIASPKSFTRDEKDWIAENFIQSSYGAQGNCIALGGWMMRFPTAKKYLVQDEYSPRNYRVYYAFDRTSLRKALMNRRGVILEYPEK